MTPQDVLFIVGISLLAVGVVCAGVAVFLFFARNIPDILADLSGKKRSDAIGRMDADLASHARGGRRSSLLSSSEASDARTPRSTPAPKSARETTRASAAKNHNNIKSQAKVESSQSVSRANVETSEVASDVTETADISQSAVETTTFDEAPARADATEDAKSAPDTHARDVSDAEAPQTPSTFHIAREILLAERDDFVQPE